MSTLKDRIDQVLEEKRFESARAWSRSAGLTETHVTQLARRNDADAVQLGTIVALARAAHVSPIWLAFGISTPEPQESREDMPLGALLLHLRARPELEAEIASEPAKWRTSTVLRALQWDLRSPLPRTREQWRAILSAAERGHLPSL